METISKSPSGKLIKSPSGKLISSTIREINQFITITTNPDSEYAFLPRYSDSWGENWYYYEFDPNNYADQDRYQGVFSLGGTLDFLAEIDYGDGTIIRTNAINGKIVFKSMNTDYYNMFGTLVDKNSIINHKYEIPGEYNITIKILSGKITSINYNYLYNNKFPIISLPYLQTINMNQVRFNNISIDSLTGLKSLKTINIFNYSKMSDPIPESLFDCINLTDITFRGLFDLSDIENSGIRKISKLKNLTSLTLGSCSLNKYIKEFNDLPKLKALYIGSSSTAIDDVYSEIDNINPNITSYFPPVSNQWEGDSCTYGNTVDRYFLKIHKDNNIDLSHISHFCCPCATWNGIYDVIDFPDDYDKILSGLTYINGIKLFRNKNMSNSLINSLYNHTIKHPMGIENSDGTRNMWYGLTITAPSNGKYGFTPPDGVYKEPNGFILGEENGNPESEMEKIYVLINNYKYTFANNWW